MTSALPSLLWADVAFCWLAMAAHALWCGRLDASLARHWLWASGRATLQLMALGFVLLFLFEKNHPLWSGMALTAMMLASAWTVASRAGVRHRHLFADCAIAISASLMLAILPLAAWMQGRNFFHAAFFFPFVGILIGNSLSGLSLGLAQWQRELRQRRDEIEFWIAAGAAPREAVRELESSVLKTSMTVVLNAMTISGLVSIPGHMTGQLLAGGSPEIAVRHQLAVLFLMAGVVFSSSWILLRRGMHRAFDDWGTLRTLAEFPR